MRTATITADHEQMTDDEVAALVRDEAPWAARWERVDGGVMCWESVTDHEIWSRQC